MASLAISCIRKRRIWTWHKVLLLAWAVSRPSLSLAWLSLSSNLLKDHLQQNAVRNCWINCSLCFTHPLQLRKSQLRISRQVIEWSRGGRGSSKSTCLTSIRATRSNCLGLHASSLQSMLRWYTWTCCVKRRRLETTLSCHTVSWASRWKLERLWFNWWKSFIRLRDITSTLCTLQSALQTDTLTTCLKAVKKRLCFLIWQWSVSYWRPNLMSHSFLPLRTWSIWSTVGRKITWQTKTWSISRRELSRRWNLSWAGQLLCSSWKGSKESLALTRSIQTSTPT